MSQTSQPNILSLKALKKQVAVYTADKQHAECNDLDGFMQELHELVATFQFDHDLENTTAFVQNVVGTLEMLFDNALKRIINNLQNEKKVDLPVLQSIVEIVSLLTMSFQKLFKFLNENQIKMKMKIVDSSHPVLGILHASYEHCKNSHNLYGENFAFAAKVLKEWFEKTFALQKIIGAALMFIEIEDNDQSKDAALATTKKLFDICQVVNGLDNMLLLTSWKLLISFLSECKVVLHGNVDSALYIESLMSCIQVFVSSMVDICKKNTEQIKDDSPKFKQLKNLCKLAVYLVNLLPLFCSDYDLEKDDESAKCLVQFLLDVISLTTPYLLNNDMQNCVKEIFSVNLLDSLSKCLNAIKSCAALQEVILTEENVKTCPVTKLLMSLKLCIVLDSSHNKDTDNWYSGKPRSLIESVFDLLPQVHNELFTCDSINLGGHRLTLYEAVVSHVCAFVSSYPTCALNHLETVLVTNATSYHPYRRLLANDVWCFVVSKSSKVCYHHVMTLAKWLSSCQATLTIEDKIGYTTQRLFSMLPPTHQIEIMNSMSPTSENLIVWRYLGGLFVANSSNPCFVLSNICEKVGNVIEDWVSHEGIASELTLVNEHICVMSNILQVNCSRIPEFQKGSKVSSTLSTFSSSLVHLLLSLPISCDVSAQLVILYSSLLHCMTYLIPMYKDNISIQKIMQRCLKILNTNTWEQVASNFCYRLVELCEVLKSSTLSADNQNTVVLLWKRLLADSRENWHLRFATLSAFERFSRVTKHPRLVARVCANDVTHTSWKSDDVEDIGALVKAHLQRTIVSLPSDVTTIDVVAMNGKALLEADAVERSERKTQSNQIQKLIRDIARNVGYLRKFSSEDLSPNDIESLRESVFSINAMFPDR